MYRVRPVQFCFKCIYILLNIIQLTKHKQHTLLHNIICNTMLHIISKDQTILAVTFYLRCNLTFCISADLHRCVVMATRGQRPDASPPNVRPPYARPAYFICKQLQLILFITCTTLDRRPQQ